MTTKLEKPSTFLGFGSFFGLFEFGYDTLAYKKTTFTVGTTTQLGTILLGVGSQNFHATTTEAALDSCLPIPPWFNLNDCVQILFVPTTRPDFESTFSTLSNKPPFGYFTSSLNILNGASTSAASTTPFGMAAISAILSPLRTGLALILWFALLLWIFNRVRHLDFQA